MLTSVKTSALKDQQSSETCWSFATNSFIETEALRLGKDEVSLSPIFYVGPAYLGKAEKFIETKGETWFDAGCGLETHLDDLYLFDNESGFAVGESYIYKMVNGYKEFEIEYADTLFICPPVVFLEIVNKRYFKLF